MPTETRALYLIDNTVLSNFAHINRPDLLRAAFTSQSATTAAVRRELALGESLGSLPRLDWQWLPTLQLNAEENQLADELRRRINSGEAECLAVAIHRGGILVSDDRGARTQAESYRVPVSGSVGVLRLLVDDKYLTIEQAEKHLSEMIAQGFYSPVKRLSDLPK